MRGLSSCHVLPDKGELSALQGSVLLVDLLYSYRERVLAYPVRLLVMPVIHVIRIGDLCIVRVGCQLLVGVLVELRLVVDGDLLTDVCHRE